MRLALFLFFAACSSEDEGIPLGHECLTWRECDDGVFCNGYEACHNGYCYGGIRESCDDDDAGTVDRCSEDAGTCVHEPRDASAQ